MINYQYVHAFLAMSLTLSFALLGCSEVERSAEDRRNPAQHTPIQARVEADFWEQIVPVHESLPEFILQFCGDGDDFTELAIVNSFTGAVVYQDYFNIEDMRGIRKDIFAVEYIDMDFDGYQDIEIFTGYGDNWKKDYIYIMWDSAGSTFVGDIYGLGGLGLPTFDAEQQLIHSMERASANDHWFYTHQYMNGELLTIEEEALNGVQGLYHDDLTREKIKMIEPLYDENHTAFIQYIRKKLNIKTMKMDIVESKFLLNDVPNATMIAEYALDSEIGSLLAQYETSSDIYGR